MPFSESKISKIQKIHQKRIGKKIYFFFVFWSFFFKNCCLDGLYYYDCRICLKYNFLIRSFFHTTQKILVLVLVFVPTI